MRRAAILGLVAALAAAPAAAEQYWARTRITSVAAVAKDSKYPQYDNVIYVGFEDRSWLPQKCRAAPGLLAEAKETALLTLALTALREGLPVVLKAEDQPMIGDYCRVFQIILYGKD